MKKIILTLTLFTCLVASAQTIQEFYDWQWKPCQAGLSRFYSVIKNTDSGWYRNDFYTATNKLQMKGLYKDSTCKIKNGSFVYFYSNGKASSLGKYSNNETDGVWFRFAYNGAMTDSGVYKMGKRTGTALGWHQNGYMSDSSVYNTDGSSVAVYWFDNGAPAAGGKTMNDKNEGKWIYFHKNGKTAAVEDYHEGKLINKVYYDEEGKELTDTTDKDRSAEFKGGSAKWRKYLEKNLVFPSEYKLVNTDIITVVIAATIDEEGNVEDAFVEIPFKTPFDREALNVIKSSPKWLPAISHNRRVKMRVRQPISFNQQSSN
jgi:TonB family protein